uniref:Uncharacterized protein n=1 Tax=Physcomitrium patens TaxID=3218 RepID=A0A2K1J8Y8_PHYPA|nr:hypothetical protein PHYPA_021102 [Physcomitrium patens]
MGKPWRGGNGAVGRATSLTPRDHMMRGSLRCEGQRDQLFSQSFNLEQVAFATEGLKDAQQTASEEYEAWPVLSMASYHMSAIKAASKNLKGTMKTLKIDNIDVHSFVSLRNVNVVHDGDCLVGCMLGSEIGMFRMQKMQDEMMYLVNHSSEIQETLSRSYGVPDDLDEELLGAADAGDHGFQTVTKASIRTYSVVLGSDDGGLINASDIISSYEHEKVTCKIQSACAPLKLSCDITHTEKEPTFKKRTLRPEATLELNSFKNIIESFISQREDAYLTLTLTSIRVRPSSLMLGSTRKGRLIPSEIRYLCTNEIMEA